MQLFKKNGRILGSGAFNFLNKSWFCTTFFNSSFTNISTIKLTCFISDAFLWKHLSWPHNMTKKGGEWAHKSRLTPPFFMGVSCTKPGRWAVMYLLARGISFYDFAIECLEMFRHVVFFVFYFNSLYHYPCSRVSCLLSVH